MEVQTVKIQGDCYLLNGNIHVPKADGNREYEIIKQWLAEGNTPEPEFIYEELVRQEHNRFRVERDLLLSKVDIAINKAEDLGEDTKILRAYRQCLRDATKDWIMPESIL